MSFLSLLFKPLLVTRSKIPTYTCLSKIRGDLNQKNTAATKTMKMMVMVMVMMVMFDVNLGGDDLFSGFSPLLNGFPGLCGFKAQAFDLGDLGSSLYSAI